MKLAFFSKFLLFFITLQSFSQSNLYTSLTVPSSLSQQANAVIRLSETDITLVSSEKMLIKQKRIITVMSKAGNSAVDAYVHYDDNVKIKTLEVLVYNKFGANIKKIRKKDFKDVSAVDGGTLYTDSRVKFLEYTPTDYPYTVEFICETETSNTAFIPSFTPVSDYFVGVENSSYTVSSPENINIRKKEKNLEGFEVEKSLGEGIISYQIKNLKSFKPEEYCPPLETLVPQVMISTNKFNYEGVNAEVEDWDSMGKWFYENLLLGRSQVSSETKQLILKLVEGLDNPIDKAKKVYQFVQGNTRYISVQVGIGGMQPISAKDVDLVKYGDCKGLTNYTKALLEIVGVESNYTRLYASPSKQLSVDKDFVSFQGQTNHVILNIPIENSEDVWLECTSQKLPFGFIGDFTDDRDALVITPDGGEITHTKKYTTGENTQLIKGNYALSSNGDIAAEILVASKGIQYDDKYWLESETERDLDMHYKKRWKYINSLSIDKMVVENDKSNIAFNESVSFKAINYTKKAGNRMLLTVNAFNRSTHVPDRYTDRKYPLKIRRGFVDNDEVEILLPPDYTVESLPKNISIENKFGSYKASFAKNEANKIVYKRTFTVNDGNYPKEDYSAFREFYKEVSKMDNAKAVLIKNQL